MSSEFKINADFGKASGTTLEEATRAQIRAFLGATNVTEYAELDDRRVVSDHLDIPAYYLAEWLAENWWPLLFEPRKSEDDEVDDVEFSSRHSFVSAQQGYALPGIKIVSNGRRGIYVSCAARNVPLADIRFLKTASLMLQPESVASELREFVRKTVHALNQQGIEESELHSAWQMVEATSEDEETYCKMIGALGLSPYADNAVDDLLFNLAERTSEREAMDLCLVAKPDNFAALAGKALRAHDIADASPPSDLAPLLSVAPAVDNLMTPAWKRGVTSAARVRENLGLSATDPKSGQALLTALGIGSVDNGNRPDSAEMIKTDEGMPIVGAVVREGDKARVGLLQTTGRGRRFAAARAAFLAWTSKADESRLLTQAVTRDQQSSRAFAAELLAPIDFLRKEAYKRKFLFKDQVDALADELGVSAGLVWKQAQNNGMTVSYQ